jgi:Tfp pilus assembly protein PilN
MGQFDLNLSTRPFKPYRATNLGLMALLLILIAVSVQQVYSYQQYSSKAAASRERESAARQEFDVLSTQLQQLNVKMSSGNSSSKLAEVEQLNQLLLRRSFSWTRLLANLERLTPDDVRLIGLHPGFDAQGRIVLNMNITGRSLADATAFLRALEESPVFTDVALAVETRKDSSATGEVEFTLSTFYNPDPSPYPLPEGEGRVREIKP